MAVGLHGFVGFVNFTGTGSVFAADFGVMFPVAGIDGLDEGAESVKVVQLADSCNFVLNVAGKAITELAVEGNITPIGFGGELQDSMKQSEEPQSSKAKKGRSGTRVEVNVGCIYASYPRYKSDILQNLFKSFKLLPKHSKLLKNIFLNFSVF